MMADEHTHVDPAGRRYDVDWLRVGALALLIIYHGVITFQPWAFTIHFPQNGEPLDALWPFMSMINVWRIPLLFLVAGMAARFALNRRNWVQLLIDRSVRILLPLVFGFFVICPIHAYITIIFYGDAPRYVPNQGHLWFLGNICYYLLFLLSLFIFIHSEPVVRFFQKLSLWIRRPGFIALTAVPLVMEALILNPETYVKYAGTAHGFCLGFLCFLWGFVFVSMGSAFWKEAERSRHVSFAIAFTLCLARILLPEHVGQINALKALETMAWLIAILGYGSCHLNRPSRILSYLSTAVYPVYIIHLPVQFWLASLVIPMDWPAWTKLSILLSGIFVVCFALYELLIKRIRLIRPLFGMKFGPTKSTNTNL